MEIHTVFSKQIAIFLAEDELNKSIEYIQSLPKNPAICSLKLKDDMILAGLPFFKAVFLHLGADKASLEQLDQYEGKSFAKNDKEVLSFKLPFNIALSGERLALNLLQRASAIASLTAQMKKAVGPQVEILDTRKTTPGLRYLEKYAVKVGGGKNHRFSQTDIWMIKDNHKNYFGGVKPAIKFFQSIKGFYQPIVLEIHKVEEITPAYELGIRHFLLDNFQQAQVDQAVELKQEGMTYELSGGISLENISNFRLSGIDAISSGSLTYNAPHVDISLKINE